MAKRPKTSTPKAKTPPKTITLAELNALLRDPNTPDAVIAQYLSQSKAHAKPLRPAFSPDPSRVHMTEAETLRARGAMAMNWANGVARWRREKLFWIDRETNPQKNVIIAEGDSWFQFPFYLEDVVDQLNAHYSILCSAAAGDTIRNMLGPKAEWRKSLAALNAKDQKAKAFLFSGGGNDIIEALAGSASAPTILDPKAGGATPTAYLATPAYQELGSFITTTLDSLFAEVSKVAPGLPIFVHGYDYALPGKQPQEWRKPKWAKIDAWIAGPMAKLGITNVALQTAIVAALISDQYQRLKALAQKHPHVTVLDLSGTMTPQTLWADELHPTDAGFGLVAAKFRTALVAKGIP
jgi:hypothetical protein